MMYQRLCVGTHVRSLPITVLALALLAPLGAAGEPNTNSRYVEMTPTIVVNYGFVDGGRMKFIRADVQLRAYSFDAARKARHHMPLLRDALLLLLSSQEDSAVMSSQGRDRVRSMALTQVREILMQEEGEPCVEDVIFSNFLVQR